MRRWKVPGDVRKAGFDYELPRRGRIFGSVIFGSVIMFRYVDGSINNEELGPIVSSVKVA